MSTYKEFWGSELIRTVRGVGYAFGGEDAKG